jgi:hypothetical protein
MLSTIGIAVGSVVAMMLFWALIQAIWRHTFKDYITDEDVLADRRSCSNCGCSGQQCTRNL